MKVLEIRVHARRRGHVKIKKINYRKVSKYRTISLKISKNKFCIKCLISVPKNSIIEKLNVWYLCARAQAKECSEQTMKWKVACTAGEFPRSSSFMK